MNNRTLMLVPMISAAVVIIFDDSTCGHWLFGLAMPCGGDMDNGLENKQWYSYGISFVVSTSCIQSDIWKKEDMAANPAQIRGELCNVYRGLMSYLLLKALSAPSADATGSGGDICVARGGGLEAISGRLDKWIGVQNTDSQQAARLAAKQKMTTS